MSVIIDHEDVKGENNGEVKSAPQYLQVLSRASPIYTLYSSLSPSLSSFFLLPLLLSLLVRFGSVPDPPKGRRKGSGNTVTLLVGKVANTCYSWLLAVGGGSG